MKTLFLLLLFPVAFSLSGKPHRDTLLNNYNKIIQQFIDAHVNTNFRNMNSAMDQDAVLKIPRGNDVIVQRKADLVDEMRTLGIVHQNCTAKYELVEKSDAMVIARVDFDYSFATQHVYLIIEKTGWEEWKITEVLKFILDRTS